MPPKKQFPWTPALEHLLVAAILSKGVHIAEKSRVRDAWKEVFETLYLQESFIQLANRPTEPVEIEKLIRVFTTRWNSLKTEVQHMMAAGNKSKYDGDLSAIFGNMCTILDEIETMKEIKLTQADQKQAAKERMEEIEESILEKKQHGMLCIAQDKKECLMLFMLLMMSIGKRPAEGEDGPARKKSSDDIMLKLYQKLDRKEVLTERDVEANILGWMRATKKNGQSALEDSGLVAGSEVFIEGLDAIDSVGGIETIVNIFCAPTKKFDPGYFKEQMAAIPMSQKVYHRLYQQLAKWKEIAEATRDKITPEASSSHASSSSSLSSGSSTSSTLDDPTLAAVESLISMDFGLN